MARSQETPITLVTCCNKHVAKAVRTLVLTKWVLPGSFLCCKGTVCKSIVLSSFSPCFVAYDFWPAGFHLTWMLRGQHFVLASKHRISGHYTRHLSGLLQVWVKLAYHLHTDTVFICTNVITKFKRRRPYDILSRDYQGKIVNSPFRLYTQGNPS